MIEVTKVWWDGEKIMAEPVDPASVYKETSDSLLDEAKLLADDRPVEIGHLPQWALDAEHMLRRLVKAFNSASQPAQRTWVGLTDEEIAQGNKESWVTEQAWQSAVWWAEAKLKERNQ
jgi:hypothetical protein